jgi:structure-specific recognition protein 1
MSEVENMMEEMEKKFEKKTKKMEKVIKEMTEKMEEMEEKMEKMAKDIKKKGTGVKKERKKKPEGSPVGMRSSYIFFCKEKREEVKKENPDMDSKGIIRKLGEMWQELKEDEEEYARFQEMAAEDKERYTAEMKEFKGEDSGDEKEEKPKKKTTKKTEVKKEKKTKKKDEDEIDVNDE